MPFLVTSIIYAFLTVFIHVFNMNLFTTCPEGPWAQKKLKEDFGYPENNHVQPSLDIIGKWIQRVKPNIKQISFFVETEALLCGDKDFFFAKGSVWKIQGLCFVTLTWCIVSKKNTKSDYINFSNLHCVPNTLCLSLTGFKYQFSPKFRVLQGLCLVNRNICLIP